MNVCLPPDELMTFGTRCPVGTRRERGLFTYRPLNSLANLWALFYIQSYTANSILTKGKIDVNTEKMTEKNRS